MTPPSLERDSVYLLFKTAYITEVLLRRLATEARRPDKGRKAPQCP